MISGVGAFAQSILFKVSDADSGDRIPSVVINYNLQDYYTDANGEVEVTIDRSKPVFLKVSKIGYESFEVAINDVAGMNSYGITLDKKATQNIILLDEGQLEDDGSSGAISSILRASRDQFLSAAAFNFRTARFNVRGYTNEFTTTMINGLPMQTLHNSRVPFDYWGGLNDVFRNNASNLGMDHNEFAFGNLNGGTNTDITAGSQRKQTRVSYALSNRSYRNRIMATHSSGETKSGWSYSFSLGRRWADEGYVEGTFYDNNSFFASVEKQLNDNHSLSLSVFGSPRKRGVGSGSIQEVYNLTDNNFYNPNWGYLNGEKKSARYWHTNEPVISLNHEGKLSDKLFLNQTVGLITGRSGQTRLDWYNAPDPRPDYYRYLPSFYDEGTQANTDLTAFLQNNPSYLQLDWNHLFETNRNNFETLDNVNGTGEVVEGLRSKYALKEDRQDLTRYMYNGNIRYQVTPVSNIYGGLTAQYEQTHFFQDLKDLLGGDYWYDVNQFVEREFPNDPSKAQPDIQNINRVVREGDTYGYNYKSHITDVSLWTSYNAIFPKIDFHVGAQLNYTSFKREGLYQTGAFPDNSLGDSEDQVFLSPGIKGGVNYKINGRNYIYANATYMERAPDFRNSFVSPRFRNQVLDNITTEKSWSGEAAYVMRSPLLNLKALGYYTQFRDVTELSSAFIDGSSGAFVNIISTGLGRTHVGTELSGSYKLSTTLTLNAAAGIGQNYIDVRPTIDLIQDNTGVVLLEDETIYVKNFRLPGAQNAYSLGLTYRSPKYWFVSLTGNYFDHMYLDYNPFRRTVDAVDGLDRDSDFYFDVLKQERLDPGFSLDLFGGMSYKIKDQFLYLNVGVNNILNNTNIVSGGFEQYRVGTVENSNTVEDLGRFPNRYFYAYGLNYFVNLSIRI